MSGKIALLCTQDPLNPRTHSGSVLHLVKALQRAGVLAETHFIDSNQILRRSAEVLSGLRWEKGWVYRSFWCQLISDYWSEEALAERSEQVSEVLHGLGSEVSRILVYGSDFAPPCLSRKQCLGVKQKLITAACFDTTCAQLVQSGEGLHADLKFVDQLACTERERKILKQFDFLFPRTEWCRWSLIEDYDLPPDRIFVSGAGPIFDLPLEKQTKHYDQRTILFVGYDTNRKNLMLLLRAFELACRVRPDLKLVVVGPDRCSETFAGVEWIGPIYGPDREERLSEIYQNASLFVLPSRFEPFGLAVVEAMTAGCPVIMLNRCAAHELIEDGVSGTVLEKETPATLAQSILYWLDDLQRLELAGHQARQRALDRFSWDKVAQTILDNFA